jgi:hypothetical protein
MVSFTFSILKILILTIIDFSIGFFWHSDYGFAEAWRKAMGISGLTKEQMMAKNPNIGKLMGIQMLLNLISVAIHYIILSIIDPKSLIESLSISFLLWLGFTANVQLNPCLWEGKPIKLFFINTGYKFTTLMTFSLLFYLF